MNRKTIIVLGAVILAIVIAVGGYFIFSSGDEAGDPRPKFTPPPLSEDPPMGGDDIDAIMKQMEERDRK